MIMQRTDLTPTQMKRRLYQGLMKVEDVPLEAHIPVFYSMRLKTLTKLNYHAFLMNNVHALMIAVSISSKSMRHLGDTVFKQKGIEIVRQMVAKEAGMVQKMKLNRYNYHDALSFFIEHVQRVAPEYSHELNLYVENMKEDVVF